MEDQAKEAVRTMYQPKDGEDRSDWKTREIFKPADALVVWRNVTDALHINPSQDVVFVSPTSNYPTHELAIFKQEAPVWKGRLTIKTGDISEVDSTEALREAALANPDGRHEFSFQQWDADNLPLKENVDILWDRKGRLWHARTVEDIKGVLERDYVYLKPGGALVIDADDGTEDQGTILPSTEQIMKRVGGENIFEDQEITNLYTTQVVGHGTHAIRLLVKK